MRTRLISIGNSKGVRIPKAVIEQCNLLDEVELDVRRDGLLLRSVNKARDGWEAAFVAMREAGDDQLIELPQTEFDRKGWRW